MVNPVLETSEIPETMPDPDNDDEGCLSVPGESFPCGRATWARVTGLDADGKPVTLERLRADLEIACFRMVQEAVSNIGRHARAAKKAVKKNGWGVPGLSWTPGEVPDPFGH